MRLSEADEVRANLAVVVAAMDGAPASAIAPLSRRREELDARLRRLEAAEELAALTTAPETRATFEDMMRSAGIEL